LYIIKLINFYWFTQMQIWMIEITLEKIVTYKKVTIIMLIKNVIHITYDYCRCDVYNDYLL